MPQEVWGAEVAQRDHRRLGGTEGVARGVAGGVAEGVAGGLAGGGPEFFYLPYGHGQSQGNMSNLLIRVR